MKVIAFNGSPHRDGVVTAGISVISDELEKEGISVETIHVGNLNIHGCVACRKCSELEHCVIEGDIVNECFEKIKTADGLILGSPVYYGGIAGTFKCFLDRLFYPRPDLKFKVGASVTTLRRSGGIAVFHELNNYFNLSQMIITPGIYWNAIHGSNAQEVREDKEGLQIMKVQGRNMAWLIKSLAEGNKKFHPPLQMQRKRTNFIR